MTYEPEWEWTDRDPKPLHWAIKLLAWVLVVCLPWALIISILAWTGVL
jgi:lauroyl/myristoyl acyltransferase